MSMCDILGDEGVPNIDGWRHEPTNHQSISSTMSFLCSKSMLTTIYVCICLDCPICKQHLTTFTNEHISEEKKSIKRTLHYNDTTCCHNFISLHHIFHSRPRNASKRSQRACFAPHQWIGRSVKFVAKHYTHTPPGKNNQQMFVVGVA